MTSPHHAQPISFLAACARGDLKMVEYISVALGVRIPYLEYGLRLAIEHSHHPIVHHLLQRQHTSLLFGAICNGALNAAAQVGDIQLVELILGKSKPDISTRSIILAANYNHHLVIERLVQDPTVSTNQLYTNNNHQAILDAAYLLHVQVFKLLLIRYTRDMTPNYLQSKNLMDQCVQMALSRAPNQAVETILLCILDLAVDYLQTNTMINVVEYSIDNPDAETLMIKLMSPPLQSSSLQHGLNLVLLMSVQPGGISASRFRLIADTPHPWGAVFHRLLEDHVLTKLIKKSSNLWIFIQIMDCWPETARMFYTSAAMAAVKSHLFIEDLVQKSVLRGTHVPAIFDHLLMLGKLDPLSVQAIVVSWLRQNTQNPWKMSRPVALKLLSYKNLPSKWKTRAHRAVQLAR